MGRKAILFDADNKKLCPKCGERKGPFDFYRAKNTASGYTSYCKECQRKSSRLKNVPEAACNAFMRNIEFMRNYMLTHSLEEINIQMLNDLEQYCKDWKAGIIKGDFEPTYILPLDEIKECNLMAAKGNLGYGKSKGEYAIYMLDELNGYFNMQQEVEIGYELYRQLKEDEE